MAENHSLDAVWVFGRESMRRISGLWLSQPEVISNTDLVLIECIIKKFFKEIPSIMLSGLFVICWTFYKNET